MEGCYLKNIKYSKISPITNKEIKTTHKIIKSKAEQPNLPLVVSCSSCREERGESHHYIQLNFALMEIWRVNSVLC